MFPVSSWIVVIMGLVTHLDQTAIVPTRKDDLHVYKSQEKAVRHHEQTNLHGNCPTPSQSDGEKTRKREDQDLASIHNNWALMMHECAGHTARQLAKLGELHRVPWE